MTVFIGDFRGTLDVRGEALRVVHVGSALAPSTAGRIERDDTVADTISAMEAFADTRIYDYVAKAHGGSLDAVGFMQYRRAFPLGPVVTDASPVGRLFDEARRRDAGEIKVAETEMAAYHRHLARLPRAAMFAALDDADIVVNRHSFGHMSVEEQFIQSQARMYPRNPEYIECWLAMKRAMGRLIGASAVDTYFSSTYAFLNNCFLTRWDEFERYRSFLFAILSELKAWNGLYRAFGYQAERIFTAWVRLQIDTRAGYRVRSLPMFAATGSAPGPAMLALRRRSDDRSLELDLEGVAARVASDEAAAGAVAFSPTVVSVRLDAARPAVTLRATLRGDAPGYLSARVWNAGDRRASATLHSDEGGVRQIDAAPGGPPPGHALTVPHVRVGNGRTTDAELTFALAGDDGGRTAIVMLDGFRLGLTPVVSHGPAHSTPQPSHSTRHTHA